MPNRIFYATHALQVGGNNIKGVQSVGINTNYNLDPIAQVGDIDVANVVEEVPEIEVSINRILGDSTKSIYGIIISGEIKDNADDTKNVIVTYEGGQAVTMTGMYVGSVTYNFPSEGPVTEEITLVGNSKTSAAASSLPALSGMGNPLMRHLVTPTVPSSIDGEVTEMSVSINFNRENILKLGTYQPFLKYATFPVEVTTEITAVASDGGDGLYDDDSDQPDCTSTPSKESISISGCGFNFDMGSNNYLQSVSYDGGGADGGNVTATYSYINYNEFTLSEA